MRFVIDTNLLVSGFLSAKGPPRQLLNAAIAGTFEFCTSEALLAELLDVLSRAKFAKRFAQAKLTPEDFINDLRRIALIVPTPSNPPRIVPNDPDDDHVLATALAAYADFIVSGDKRHLLNLKAYQGIPIINARASIELSQTR